MPVQRREALHQAKQAVEGLIAVGGLRAAGRVGQIFQLLQAHKRFG
jgi:hypothetical protein